MPTRRESVLTLLMGVLVVAGCGGPTGGSGPVQISISPTSVTLAPGATQLFTAALPGVADASVTWSATCGAIGSGNPSTYTAPTVVGSCTVRVTSVERPDSTASASVTVAAAHGAPGVAWTRQFGTREDDRANGVAFDSSGNIYVVGFTSDDLDGENAGSWTPDAFVRKYSSTGEVSWTRQFGTSGQDYANAVAVDAAGSIVVVGQTNGDLDGPAMGGVDAFVRMLDPDGNVLWARQFGGRNVEAADAVATDGSGIYVAGRTTDALVVGESGGTFLQKYDHAGNVLWTRQFGGANSYGAGVAVDGHGDVVLVGNDSFGVTIGKFSSDGTVRWARHFAITNRATARDVAIAPTGIVFVAGEVFHPRGGYDYNITDGFVRTYDADGNELWTYLFDDFGSGDSVEAVAINASGHAVAFGREKGSLFLRAIDASANVLWTRQFGTDESDHAEDIAFSATAGMVIAGGTVGDLSATNAGYEDAFVRLYRP